MLRMCLYWDSAFMQLNHIRWLTIPASSSTSTTICPRRNACNNYLSGAPPVSRTLPHRTHPRLCRNQNSRLQERISPRSLWRVRNTWNGWTKPVSRCLRRSTLIRAYTVGWMVWKALRQGKSRRMSEMYGTAHGRFASRRRSSSTFLSHSCYNTDRRPLHLSFSG